MRALLHRLMCDTSGNIAVIFAFAAIPILALMGAGIDFTRTNTAHAHLQSAIDTAVLSGVTQPSGSQVLKATQVFNANLDLSWASDVTPAFVKNADGTLSGTVTAHVPTTVMRLVRQHDFVLNVTAKAAVASGGNVCILLLAPSAAQSLLANSGAKINAPDCEIHVKSTANPAAIFNANTTLTVNRVCVKGANVIKNGGTAPVETACAAADDPFAGTLPAVTVPGSCTTPGPYNGGSSVTLAAGNYCNVNFNNYTTVNLNPGMLQNINFNGSPTVNLSAGLYIIKGTVTLNSGAKLNGTGVTFYFADANSKIQFNGNVTSKVVAPTSGTYANILFFEPTGLSKTQWPINGSAGSAFSGLWYLPSRDVTINSVSNASMDSITMVFNTLILNSTNWMFQTSPKTIAVSGGGGGGPYLMN